MADHLIVHDHEEFAIDPLLSPEGWAYASTPPVEDGDPGRFHALFGRDSLIFALQVLPERPEIAAATLRALARRQGRITDPVVEEEPGRILHEFRPTPPQWLVDAGFPQRDGQILYYGSADSTSWFLVVLAAAESAGGAAAQLALATELEPAWRAAGQWLLSALERGNGLVRHGYPGAPLLQQGWRDAHDPADADGGGILRLDGTPPTPPLADADSQAAAVAALDALAQLDPDGPWPGHARDLRARLTAAFTPDVMALEHDDQVVPGAGSQLGWLLWADALGPSAAQAAADRLIQPDILTSAGLRTLSSDHPQFAPEAYHRGAIWPFDNWIGWLGLRRAGRAEQAEQVRRGVLGALEMLGRAPELYAVTVDGQVQPIPVSNRVQAWSVGAARAFKRAE